MLRRLEALLTWLRSRPPYERRLLAISSYLGLSAVIIAVGLISLRDTVLNVASINTIVPPPAQGPQAPAAEEVGAASGSGLATPFGTLVKSLGQAVSRLTGDDNRTSITDRTGTLAPPPPPPPPELESKTLAARPAFEAVPPAVSPTPPPPPSAAGMVATVGFTTGRSAAELALLLRSPWPSGRAGIIDIVLFWR